ncbi:MAG TPA: lipoyl(octanoyl) transferase LipB [Flavobacteriales bacterium]|nr:lipoyl(octanoyl) transferase LipB [Flavobacteriales bacterium]HHZ94995.1 lipoyl(octanoyl) transferase LipB [Flavobacteriales bacterium]HIB77230.1 lipoyl(octanoyl) transferase LipB [Flavobacteriales bacterium]HIO59096.1 lipoyl(octanoyl) transferase LipB [Flavobacteriales bacterium]
MKKLQFEDLGTMRYKACWDYQETVFKSVIARKIDRRNAETEESRAALPLPTSRLLFVEHPHVITLGKSGNAENVLVNPARLAEMGVDYFPINRGGDITYHGPGQLVAYPILDLDQYFTDIHKYLRFLEEGVIRTCADFGVEAGRIEGLTGVWVDIESGSEARKICAFGVKCSRWVTMHGLAFNIDSDLNFFDLIVPCGIKDRGVTTLSKEVGRKITLEEVKPLLKSHLQELFGWEELK